MKRILSLLISICMVSLFALSAHAQSIVGTWVTDGTCLLDGEEAAEAKKAELYLTFKANGTTAMAFDVLMEVDEDGVHMTLGMKVNVPGTYKKTGNNIKMNMNAKQTNVNFYKFDINLTQEMEQALAAMGMTKQQLKTAFQQQFPAQDISNLLSGDLNIIKLTNTTLEVIEDDGVTLTFTRKQ